ncbi:MAG: hypothetical protein H7A27_02560 [Spirochaetaceae bacterium]|nr:hypothetical protein [Spirochaetaceae bacterium]
MENTALRSPHDDMAWTTPNTDSEPMKNDTRRSYSPSRATLENPTAAAYASVVKPSGSSQYLAKKTTPNAGDPHTGASSRRSRIQAKTAGRPNRSPRAKARPLFSPTLKAQAETAMNESGIESRANTYMGRGYHAGAREARAAGR